MLRVLLKKFGTQDLQQNAQGVFCDVEGAFEKVCHLGLLTKLAQEVFCDVESAFEKSCIQETKHLSTNADSSTDTIIGWTKNTQKPNFFEKTEKIIQNAKTQKHLETCQNQRYALRPEVSNPLGSVVYGWTKNTPKPELFEAHKKSPKTQKLKKFRNLPKLALHPSS